MRLAGNRMRSLVALVTVLGLALTGYLTDVGPKVLAVAGATDSGPAAVSVFDGFIPRREQAAIRAGTSRYDATADIQRAVAAVSGTGKALQFPAGTYLVGQVVFSGHDYTVETAGVTFRQRPGLTGDGNVHPIITFPPGSAKIRLGDVRLVGNIATDRDEYSHGIAVISAKNITIGNVAGENIRGDVLYTYGRTSSEAEYQRNLVTGTIRGKNIYRCIVAMAGGQARIAGIVQEGPVGYRDLDIEPNAGGAYQPVEAVIGPVRGSTVQITSADEKLVNASVTIESLDLDGDRIADTMPSYPRHPGRGAFALSIDHVDTVKIGLLRLRNYDGRPVQLDGKWRSISIGTLDFARSDTRDPTYKAIVFQHGAAGAGVLSIDRIVGEAAGPDRFVLRSDRGLLKVDVGSVDVDGGKFGAYLTGRVREIAKPGENNREDVCPLGCRDLRIDEVAPAP